MYIEDADEYYDKHDDEEDEYDEDDDDKHDDEEDEYNDKYDDEHEDWVSSGLRDLGVDCTSRLARPLFTPLTYLHHHHHHHHRCAYDDDHHHHNLCHVYVDDC